MWEFNIFWHSVIVSETSYVHQNMIVTGILVVAIAYGSYNQNIPHWHTVREYLNICGSKRVNALCFQIGSYLPI